MTSLNHTVEQFTTATHWSEFEGLNTLKIAVTVPDWHEPWPINVRLGKENPRTLELIGLLHISHSWYINGPVADQWTISTLNGPVKVPAGTLVTSEEMPESWKAWQREADKGKKEWYAYSNGRTSFC